MRIQPNILNIKQQFEEIIQMTRDRWVTESDRSDLPEVIDAIHDVLDHLHQYDRPEARHSRRRSDQKIIPNNLSELGDHCIQLFQQLIDIAVLVEDTDIAKQIELLPFPFALWLTQHGGELRTLSPVVNSIAQYTNQTRHIETLERLYHMVSHILDGVCQRALQQDDEENQKAWRVLLVNHGIIATRTHNCALIEAAYQNLADKIPEDAPDFFEQGMQQMVKINYPEHVRTVVKKFYLQWSQSSTLH